MHAKSQVEDAQKKKKHTHTYVPPKKVLPSFERMGRLFSPWTPWSGKAFRMHACLTQHNTLALERHVGFVMHFVHCTCIIVQSEPRRVSHMDLYCGEERGGGGFVRVTRIGVGGLLSDELAYFQGIRKSFAQSTIVPAPHPPNQPNS